MREALAALDNPSLVGEPRMPEDVPQPAGDSLFGGSTGAVGGIYMGQ